jgi:signal transduction histidine kinase
VSRAEPCPEADAGPPAAVWGPDLEGRLRQTQQLAAVGQVAARVAHDFNNLLTAIMGYSEIVRDSLGPAHACASDIEQVLAAGRRAEVLARQLLLFSRGQRHPDGFEDLGRVLEDFSPLLRRLAGDDIQMEIACGDRPAWVRADRGRLEFVLMHLAMNARDAMGGRGRLTIGVSADDGPAGTVRLRVADDGPGMPAAVRARIFEPFFTTKPGHSGLGLCSVQGIVRDAEGAIEIESAAGVGTAVIVTLPQADAHEDDGLTAFDRVTTRECR